jgi:hypothetical protein
MDREIDRACTEIDNLYKVLYENYNSIMRDYTKFTADMKKFQTDILTLLNKYPSTKDLERWRKNSEGMQ